MSQSDASSSDGSGGSWEGDSDREEVGSGAADRGPSRRSSEPSQQSAGKGAGGFGAAALPAGLHFTGDADEDAAMLEALEVPLLALLSRQPSMTLQDDSARMAQEGVQTSHVPVVAPFQYECPAAGITLRHCALRVRRTE